MKLTSFCMSLTALAVLAGTADAAGILTPKGAGQAPIEIRNHHLDVVINNGFARTEVRQTFYNPNSTDLEAVYSFPLPTSASLSEVTVYVGETEIHGEVLEKQRARQVYEEERRAGGDAGLAEKNSFHSFDFNVTPVRAQQETDVRIVYYQPLEIDTGVGRYIYPLEEGGTDEAALSFWDANPKVAGSFSASLELKSAAAIADVRTPGYEGAATIDQLAEGHYKLRMDVPDASLSRDFVFYYRLADDLPGRIEVLPYRDDPDGPGTFMMIVTPGMDLKPITGGADYSFVLDVSGSMASKIATLADGVERALGQMKPGDRVRVIAFSETASEVTNGWVDATPENMRRVIADVHSLGIRGGTNVYEGLQLALADLDDDRASSVILVTDGVTNTGIVDPREFHKLMDQVDVRVFGFLMGNSANWPLMRTIADASGGFYSAVSNDDDIVGQILLAKSKITHEALHDAEVKISGVKTFNVTGDALGKVYRGQQLVLFGRYQQGGDARVTLTGRLTGEDKTYSTNFRFPDLDDENPELERLWALAQIEDLEVRQAIGELDGSEMETAITDLGLQYQLVTDYTSMVVLSDGSFESRGIERRNRDRVAKERQAQAVRASAPARQTRVDRETPAFKHRAPRIGGGAIDPLSLGLIGGLAGLALRRRSKRAQR